MQRKELQSIRKLLRTQFGWAWPSILLEGLRNRVTVFNNTQWCSAEGAEAEFVRRLSVIPALYASLESRLGKEAALQNMQELLIPFGCSEQWGHLNRMGGNGITGMERLMAFHNLMDREGAPRFNTRQYIQQDEKICHFLITRCIFHEIFSAAGTPELTKAFCEVDRVFFPEAFPDFQFHRAGSWENTIAYGREHCVFVFEKRN